MFGKKQTLRACMPCNNNYSNFKQNPEIDSKNRYLFLNYRCYELCWKQKKTIEYLKKNQLEYFKDNCIVAIKLVL